MYNQDFFQNTNVESNITGDNNYITNDINIDTNMNNMNNGPMMGNPINEGVQERVVHRTFVHEVPQDCSFMIEK